MHEVMKCDFCQYTNKSVITMMEHEAKCTYIKKNNKCHSCDNYESEFDDYSFCWGYRCEAGIEEDKMHDYPDTEPCEFWTVRIKDV